MGNPLIPFITLNKEIRYRTKNRITTIFTMVPTSPINVCKILFEKLVVHVDTSTRFSEIY